MIDYKRVSTEDIPLLVHNRIDLLLDANSLQDIAALDLVKEQLYQYYTWSIPTNNHIAYLAFENSLCIGTGGICFYQVLPTYHNPTGRKAYITNMYTIPEFRNRGVATHILDSLVKESLRLGVKFISLEATESGRPIYKKYGFVQLNTEMQLYNEVFDTHQNEFHK
ncbi:GNAT family N-acetyltransferase [Pseudoflavonifractor sp. An187]|uniref:GNAT family N-acetyltransferase n=1 Tax=Pseudoflavonifractor sp. An187 TaxID=1965578 RepID=UPI000B38F535|nr:GNAT family N-acetyltransferase [Pseudoflavonifractor sp. An187]OUP44895.1 hypothetical protein B5F22_05780 [Pseudoflavonifractor sp. An187]